MGAAATRRWAESSIAAASQALEADGARRLRNESFFSAPQLKRDPLGDNMIHGRISVAVLGGLLMADAAGCHPVDTNQSVAPGRCLDLTFGAWAPAYQMDGYRPFPTRVHLIDSLIDPGSTRPVFKARRWPLDSGRLATWWRPTTDSIQLTFPS